MGCAGQGRAGLEIRKICRALTEVGFTFQLREPVHMNVHKGSLVLFNSNGKAFPGQELSLGWEDDVDH